MKSFARNTALLLMLTAGSLALPCMAQQEVSPDIYDATPRSSATVTKQAKPAGKPAPKTMAHHNRAQHKSSQVMLASAKAPRAAASRE